MPRFVSPRMEFVINGRPLVSGRIQKDSCFNGGRKAYINLIKLSAKTAMLEWDFKYTEEPIYIAIGIYVGVHDKNMLVEDVKKIYSGKVIVNKKPYVASYCDTITKALKGIVFKSESQIVSCLTIKKYSRRERVEVLIGKPNNVKELEHDIRNA